jgi:hypothetical protein
VTAFVALVGMLEASCASLDATDAPTTGVVHEPMVKGVDSSDAQNSAVLVMHYDPLSQGGATTGCSGTLLAPRLVLTARHCVSDTDEGTACTPDGKPVSGGAVHSDDTATDLYVFGGKTRPDFLDGTARPSIGEQIVTTGAETLCNEDLAMIVLSTPVEGATIAPIRLDGGPKKGEPVTVVGWGIVDDGSLPQTRKQKTDLSVLELGPAPGLGPTEFTVGEGPCSGDSGGPAYAASGAVIGALSRGGNGAQAKGASECVGGTNLYTSIAGHADFIRSGYAKVGQVPWLEGMPNPLNAAPLGVACTANSDCQTSNCDPDQKACTQICDVTPCPGGFSCVDHRGTKVCVETPTSTSGSGCTTAHTSGGSAPTTPIAAALAWAVLALVTGLVRSRCSFPRRAAGKKQ